MVVRSSSIAAAFILATVLAISSVAVPSAHAQEPTAAASVPVGIDSTAVSSMPFSDSTTTRMTVDNPYGFGALWDNGGPIAKGTLCILFAMSLGSWYILLTKLYESFKISAQAREARDGFFQSVTLQEAIKTLRDGSAFRFIAESGVTASEHHEGALTENIDRATWVTSAVQRAIDDVQSRLQDGLAVLATVGSTAPFVGLFGTVWGIYHALTEIGIAGQASIDKVAGPVGEALIMTAIGLAVAVPAVLGYNWLVRRNKVNMESVRNFGADLHGVLMGARMKPDLPR